MPNPADGLPTLRFLLFFVLLFVAVLAVHLSWDQDADAAWPDDDESVR